MFGSRLFLDGGGGETPEGVKANGPVGWAIVKFEDVGKAQ